MSQAYSYWLTNVRLDSGFETGEDGVVHTRSELCHLKIQDGVISEIVSATKPLDTTLLQQDANGLLALPSFVEKHNHLDKTYAGATWKSCLPPKKLIDRLEFEATEMPLMTGTTQKRAEAMLQLLLNGGATHVRTHVNIDPYIGLKNLEGVRAALEAYSDRMTYEIVAFPQQGLLRTQASSLMRQAMKEGATLVGGLDPAGIDNELEGSLREMMDIAVEADADVDIHLHDPGTLGFYTIKRILDLTEEAGWQNRMAISHAFALGDVSVEESTEMAERLSRLGTMIMTTVPINRAMPPVPILHEKGVRVALGYDGFYDSWSPYGTGDMLEKLNRLVERYRWVDERSLVQSLFFITGGKTTLDRAGNRAWPKAGDEASIVFAEASCSAEAIARRSRRAAVMFKGKVVHGALERRGEN
ncbi:MULTISPECIES: amidohydrolase family protein [Brevibacillus]|uniref:amidohydrolase family protein n=1 Tax=Brevibacillus TaxID=55080 RepID=UPI002473F869|nr:MULTISPECIES: amidohydrolase family protein [Brevibacillus]MDH6348502.1 cytosine/adenosine deaminase-related metal-dependent hydrolase [Brevibacillus sp. 1238]MDR5002350.1 amidohydrolase family protein [Brevibacillus parabrevis]